MIINKKKFALLRAEKNLMVKEILQKAKCSHYVSGKIKNQQHLDPCTVGKIAHALNVSVADIIVEEGD